MILGSLAKQPIPCLTIQSGVIERVDAFKLLGVTVSNDLSWAAHANAICARVAPRLYYLKQLKRTGLPAADLLYFYLTVIRPVLEYGCAVWHRAFAGVQPLSARSYELRRRFFRFTTQSESCLHNLPSQQRDSEILFRLRRHFVYSIPLTKTNKFVFLFTMPLLNISNISNRINKISLTALLVSAGLGRLMDSGVGSGGAASSAGEFQTARRGFVLIFGFYIVSARNCMYVNVYWPRVSGPQPFDGLRTQQHLLYLRFYIAYSVEFLNK